MTVNRNNKSPDFDSIIRQYGGVISKVCYFYASNIDDFHDLRQVTEVAQKGISCRKLHHIFQIILISLGIVLIAYLAFVMTDNKAAIYGMCIGGAVGLAIGLKTYFKMMDNYKDLIQN